MSECSIKQWIFGILRATEDNWVVSSIQALEGCIALWFGISVVSKESVSLEFVHFYIMNKHCKRLCIGCLLFMYFLSSFFSLGSHCSDSCSSSCSNAVQGAGNHCRWYLLCPWSVCCTRGKAPIQGHSLFLLVRPDTSKHGWIFATQFIFSISRKVVLTRVRVFSQYIRRLHDVHI